MKSSSRRQFIADTATIGIASLISAPAIASIFKMHRHSIKAPESFPMKTGFTQEPLPYTYNALEPYIDEQTMELHYSKHAAAYCKNLNEAAIAEKVDITKPVEDVLTSISKYSTKMRNNAGGHYNHEMFWKCMQPNGNEQPKETLLTAIQNNFTSVDNFKAKFDEAAKARFGSGWAWLIVTGDKKLSIVSTPNQDNTLMDIAETKGFPLFGIDVWEHAYYLKYQNRRAEYIDSFWKVLNWDYIQQRFDSAI
jgi:Fe-Mn family superoxide dismutase